MFHYPIQGVYTYTSFFSKTWFAGVPNGLSNTSFIIFTLGFPVTVFRSTIL